MNGFSHSHYSVPGMFFPHHAHPCCQGPPNPYDHQISNLSNGGYPEDHYESASICYGSPAAAASGHRTAGLKPRNYPSTNSRGSK